MASSQRFTKSVRLNREQTEQLAQISQTEGLSEAALMQRFVLEGLARYQLETAIRAYRQGEIDLTSAARHAHVSIYHMMNILATRDITVPAASEKFVQGLKSLVETFGGSDALRQTIAELEQQAAP